MWGLTCGDAQLQCEAGCRGNMGIPEPSEHFRAGSRAQEGWAITRFGVWGQQLQWHRRAPALLFILTSGSTAQQKL